MDDRAAVSIGVVVWAIGGESVGTEAGNAEDNNEVPQGEVSEVPYVVEADMGGKRVPDGDLGPSRRAATHGTSGPIVPVFGSGIDTSKNS